MKYAYDLCGAEPIIKDMPVYDSATIQYGEMVMLGATAFSAGADAGIAYVTAAPSTVGGTQAVDALGICIETVDTDNAVNGSGYASDNPSVATAWNTVAAAGGCTAKCIINPFAVYRAEVNGDDAFAIASSASTDEFAVTGVGQNSLNGAWVFFNAPAGPNYGELRQIVSSAAGGTQNMDSAVGATITTADTALVIGYKSMYSNILDDTATMVSQTSIGNNTATNLRIVESYVNKNDGGFEILKSPEHKGIKIGSGNAALTKFYNDIMMKDHVFGVQE